MIEEFPYKGKIERITESGFGDDTTSIIYDGVMDCTLVTDESGKVAQTADYIVSIPLVKDSNGNYIFPKKEDTIVIMEFGVERSLKVSNYMPSQVGGVTIYCSTNN
jgi:hypothetical protein